MAESLIDLCIKTIIMEQSNKSHSNNKDEQTSNVKPDEETLHTTDPQEKMEGPVSSIANRINDGMKGDVSQEEADQKKEDHM